MISVCLKTEKLSSRARAAAAAAGFLLFSMAVGNCVGNAEVKLNALLKTLVRHTASSQQVKFTQCFRSAGKPIND